MSNVKTFTARVGWESNVREQVVIGMLLSGNAGANYVDMKLNKNLTECHFTCENLLRNAYKVTWSHHLPNRFYLFVNIMMQILA